MMRSSFSVRRSRATQVAAGAVTLAMPVVPHYTVALAAGNTDRQSALQASLNHHHLAYGQALTVTGHASRAMAGRTLVLEYAPAGEGWRVIRSASVHSDGSYRLVAPLQQSGAVRVIAATSAGSARATRPNSTAAGASSTPEKVAVGGELTAKVGSIDALGGQPVHVLGTLLQRHAGRLVRLEGRSGSRWHTLATARTRRNGHFDLRYSAGDTGQQPVRVSFAGDRLNGAARSRSGRMTVYRESLASWYDDGGATGCGFHTEMGVANKALPCGTEVTFRYGGRSVTATVDDRGPYVGDREWDLNQNAASALGFDGVATVWASR
jgi:hypothetical protein